MMRRCIFSSIAILILTTGVVACGTASTPSALATASPVPTPIPLPLPLPTSTYTPSPTATLTPEPEWYRPLDESYIHMEYRYGLVTDPQARVYATLNDAVQRTGNFGFLRSIPAYVSVVGEAERDGRRFYTVYYGWMEAEQVQLLSPSRFRGVLLTRPVDFRFGWVLMEAQSTNRQGEPVRTYRRYDFVHEVPNEERPGWFAVGPDEWLPEEVLAITHAQVPSEAKACRFLYVDLAEQTLRVYDQCRLVFATLVSTGRESGWTFPGRFAILQKFPYIQLTPPPGSLSVYYLEGVPYFMSYSGDWGFHAAYWHDDFGKPVSHGCVNLSPADARWLYEWAQLGERVIISTGENP